jgi:hypothetical protein
VITLYRFRSEPSGAAYERLLRYLLENERWFGLVWAEQFKFAASALEVKDDLAAFLVGRRRTDHWPGTQLIGHFAKVDTYRCDLDALPILLRPGSLFSWLQPKYPEDLHFTSAPRLPSLITSAHEKDGWIANPKVARDVSQLVSLKKETFESKHREIFGLEA